MARIARSSRPFVLAFLPKISQSLGVFSFLIRSSTRTFLLLGYLGAPVGDESRNTLLLVDLKPLAWMHWAGGKSGVKAVVAGDGFSLPPFRRLETKRFPAINEHLEIESIHGAVSKQFAVMPAGAEM